MMKILFFFTAFTISTIVVSQLKNQVFIEAESFQNKGGWVVDQQFMDLMDRLT